LRPKNRRVHRQKPISIKYLRMRSLLDRAGRTSLIAGNSKRLAGKRQGNGEVRPARSPTYLAARRDHGVDMAIVNRPKARPQMGPAPAPPSRSPPVGVFEVAGEPPSIEERRGRPVLNAPLSQPGQQDGLGSQVQRELLICLERRCGQLWKPDGCQQCAGHPTDIGLAAAG
jgi:hypothetical protein